MFIQRTLILLSRFLLIILNCLAFSTIAQAQRQRININENWQFMRYEGATDSLIYDIRPTDYNKKDDIVADTRATLETKATASAFVLKPFILPTANEFIKNPAQHFVKPKGNPGANFPFVQSSFNDSGWQTLNLPHDWAINKPFYKEANAIVGGGMGRLPIQGVAWYRKKLDISKADQNKNIYLDVDGAMSYAMVWVNGHLAGGWPYGYNSFRINLTPYLNFGGANQLAIRIDNPPNSARWYPGAGIYRNVWLTKTNPVHVAHWGTFVRSKNVTKTAADIDIDVKIQNKRKKTSQVKVITEIYTLTKSLSRDKKVATTQAQMASVGADKTETISTTLKIQNPNLWEALPSNKQAQYLALTKVFDGKQQIDEYETRFGIRSIEFDAEKGLLVNQQPIKIQGVNQHHDLGALGGAFNRRAAQRQLEMLKELGCNAIRLAHNPPAPELLDLTDSMGFLVIDEVFDCWEKGKTALDFHLIFKDWYEADLRSFIRRDKNHPSIIAWSYGNEVGEQYTDEEGAALSKKLYDIVKDEDPTRPATASMNYAKPDMPFPAVMDILSLNYQGEGIRDAPAYSHLKGIRTHPLYPAFHQAFPDKLIFSSETASALSTRGTYLFPVTPQISAPVSDTSGGNPVKQIVSAYDLYTSPFGASPDKVFASQDKHPYVAGEFVWSGWDYLGEPTPYYGARSSYCGIIDLAGFKKDRYYLYQARWRPDLPMAHILPHWTWPDREGKITPVHVYSSADEAELFLNGKSLGRKKLGEYEYRFRWDDVKYQPGALKVVTYKNGQIWASDSVATAGKAYKLVFSADRNNIKADGQDLSFVTVEVRDEHGNLVPEADNLISFEVEGVGDLVATDNGNPADLNSFALHQRNAFSGLALAIVKSREAKTGKIKITAKANGMLPAYLEIISR